MPTDARLLSAARAVADGAKASIAESGLREGREQRLMDALDVVAQIRQHAVGVTHEPGPGGGSTSAASLMTEREPATLTLSDGTPIDADWEHVHLLEKVGEGAFGAVFRALDRSLDLEIALKVIAPGHEWAGNRILEEGRRLARLRHPNVVRVYGVDHRPPHTGLRMEFIRGLTVEEQVAEHGPMEERECCRIGIDVCHALAALHANGIVHRDVKAANVMLADDGRVVLMDLGTGITPEESPRDRRHFAGTPMYVPPEVLRGVPQDARADVYAVGVLLYHALTGEYPYPADTVDAREHAQQEEPRRPIEEARPEITTSCADVVNRAIAPTAEARYADAESLARALSRARTEAWARASRGTARTVSEHPSNLPSLRTPFVGRERRLGTALAAVSESRLVTFTGPGGSGKTRLAIEAGRELLEEIPDGVWMVELAPISRADRIADALVHDLGVRPGPKQTTSDALVEHLQSSGAVIIVDNCEHLLDASATLVSQLLSSCPRLRIIATSRERLSLTDERTLPVEPLTTPASQRVVLDDARRTESVRLFVGCASGADARFVLSEENVSAVAEICRRLDGIPLALELAAMQVVALSPQAIVERLDERFRLLRRGQRDAQAHHRTLRALVDWSYDLLSGAEQALLRRLSLFPGGWDLDAAEAAGEEVAGRVVVDCLFELVTKSLVEASTERDGGVRYRLLDTIRAYASERLAESTDAIAAGRAFRAHYLDLAKEGSPHLRGAEQHAWRARLGVEHDNLLAALESFMGDDTDITGASELLVSIGWLWTSRGHWALLRRLAEELINHPRAGEAGDTDRASVLALASDVADHQGDYDAATVYQTESLEIRRALGDEIGIAMALGGLGVTAFNRGEYDAARAHHEESLALHRKNDNLRGMTRSLNNLATVLECQGEYALARQHLAEGLEIARELEDDWGVTAALNNLGIINARLGDLDEATRHFEEVLERNRQMGDRWGTAVTAHNLGEMCIEQGRLEDAHRLIGESLEIWSSLDDQRGVAASLYTAGVLAEREGETQLSVRLITSGSQILEAMQAAFSDADRRSADAALGRARERLGEDGFADAEAHARRLAADVVIKEGLSWLLPDDGR